MLPCRIACVRIGRFATGAASRRAGVGASPAGDNAPAPRSPTGPPAEPPRPPPLALVADVRGAARVLALSREAERRGAARGMVLAEARAVVADLAALPWSGEEIARAALEVTTALLAASPRVAWAGGGRSVPLCPRASVPLAGGRDAGLWWVDAAGLGSEAKLARRLARLAAELGFGHARVGVADSAVAAYAATYGRGHRGTEARGHGDAACPPRSGGATPVRRRADTPVRPIVVSPGGDAPFLAPFPLALLEPGEDLAETCDALGLRTVGQFAALDAGEVETRFGPEGLALHRLARGLDTRGPSAPRDDTLPVVACDLGSPVATAEPLLFVLKGALASLSSALRAKGLAAREISIALTLDDGSTAERAVRPARPTSHESALFDHCRAAFEGWALPEPVVALAVRAAVTVPASGEQGDLLAPRWAEPAALEAAFDRIRGREGADAVAAPVAREGHLPRDAGAWEQDRGTEAQACRRTDAAAGERRTKWRAEASTDGAQPGGPPGPREREAAALRLLPSPTPVRVRLGRSGIEAFRHGETWHDVTAWSGPERLAPRWWVPGDGRAAGSPGAVAAPTGPATPDAAAPRDYYTARTADGALWLLFRGAASHGWFVEGWWD